MVYSNTGRGGEVVIIGGGSGETNETRVLNVELCYRFKSVRHFCFHSSQETAL